MINNALMLQHRSRTASEFSGTLYSRSISSNTMRYSLDFGETWTEIPTASVASALFAVSADGRYIACFNAAEELTVSSDYGATWTTRIASRFPLLFGTVCGSSTGQYMYAFYTNNSPYGYEIYKSSNYGATWVLVFSYSSEEVDSYAKDIDCSANGRYVVCATYFGYAVSSDYGVTFTHVDKRYNLSAGYVKVSSTGQNVVLSGQTYGGISANYASSFSALSSSLVFAAISDNAQYRLVYNIESGVNKLKVSANSGGSWTYVTIPTSSCFGVGVSASGQMMYVLLDGNKMMRSSNFGVTWSTLVVESQFVPYVMP